MWGGLVLSTETDLHTIDLFDEWDEEGFHRLATLASSRLSTPVALISIIDEARERQFFKAAVGLKEPWKGRGETPLSHSICKLVAAEGTPVVVPDARKDARLIDHLAVSELDAISYLGTPIGTQEGEALGALCVIDSKPRDWTEHNLNEIVELGHAVSSQLKLQLAVRDAERARQRAEAATRQLQDANRLFVDLANNVPGAIFRYIWYDDDSEEITYMSPGCFDIWELSADEVQGDPSQLWNMVVPEDLPDMQASVRRSAQDMTQWSHRWCVLPRSGKRKWLQGYGQPQRLHDGVLWNTLILDVTGEVEAQQTIDRNRQMLFKAQKQEITGRLAGGIAHDFNNLLAIVLGNSELLLADPKKADIDVYLNEVKSAALRGSDLTRWLLSFARRSDLQPEALDVNDAIGGVQNLLRRTLPENITLNTKLSDGLWRTKADKGFLESALLNLVVNAKDAMPNGGALTIETAAVPICDAYIAERSEDIEPGRYVLIAVTDTGDGIDAQDIAQVFDPFFTTKGPDAGTGLGLSMVHGFAKQSGGTVQISSELGRGTSVKVYLRAHDDERAKPPTPRVPPAPGKGTGTVLLVEDNDAVRRVAKLSLESVGYSVIEAGSGDEGYAIYSNRGAEIDIVVTDVVMPGKLQGPDMVAAIRRDNVKAVAVFMSGYPDEASVHGQGIGRDDLSLTKPVMREELIAAVQTALATRR